MAVRRSRALRWQHILAPAAAFVVAILFTVAVTSSFAASRMEDDPVRGRITIENEAVKAVFGYKATSTEGHNRGGGNLYELYDRRTDPAARRNLIARAPGGTGNTSNQGVGFGGVGSTGMYAWATLPAMTEWPFWKPYVADNNLDGTLKDYTTGVNPDGAIELVVEVEVQNRHTAIAWYRVRKTWLIEPNGRINLTLGWTLLRSGWLSEASVRNQWSWDRGWTRLAKFGHDWDDSTCDQGVASNGVRCPRNYWRHISIGDVYGNCWNDQNRFHVQKVRLTGSSTAPDVVMEVDNVGPDGNNWGVEGGGLWRLSRMLTDEKAVDSVFEQCTYNRRAIGDGDAATGLGWYSWWGGDPATPERYRYVDLDANPDLARWQEKLVFDLYPPSPSSPLRMIESP
jgi:hypothetical protein